MAKRRLSGCYLFVTLFCSSLSDIWFVPLKTFLQDNKAHLRCYGKIDGFYFSNNFEFYRNNEPLEGEGGAPQTKVKDAPVVYYELKVDQPGVYTCIVAEENVTAEVYEPPDAPLPLVSETGKQVNLLCPKGPFGSESKLEVTDKSQLGLITTDSNKISIPNIDIADVFSSYQCIYRFPSDKRTVAINLHLIVMKIEVVHKTYDVCTVNCTAYSNLTDISIILITDGNNRMYSKFSTNFVFDDVNRNISNVTCTVWYKNQEIWSTVISLEEKYSAPSKQTGVSVCVIALIISGIIIVLGSIMMVIYLYKKHQTTMNCFVTVGSEKVAENKAQKEKLRNLSKEEATAKAQDNKYETMGIDDGTTALH